jgi:hypothetical protein
LLYPGKIAIDNEHGRLFISDSNNHRIVVTDLQGAFLDEIGTRGSLGFKDGSFAEAKFNRLQGVAYHKTGTCMRHVMRGRVSHRMPVRADVSLHLNYLSPADEHERLYVADAENHALRVVDLKVSSLPRNQLLHNAPLTVLSLLVCACRQRRSQRSRAMVPKATTLWAASRAGSSSSRPPGTWHSLLTVRTDHHHHHHFSLLLSGVVVSRARVSDVSESSL